MTVQEVVGPFRVIGKGEPTAGGSARLLCECIHCHRRVSVSRWNAKRAKSCGCRKGEFLSLARTTHGHSRHKGAKSGSPTYETWHSMLLRCENPNHSNYEHYGAVGITVCERWHVFENFLADMGERPMGKTLDRYPVQDGNYEPGNCRWANATEQANNRRSNRKVTWQGRRQTISEWATELGLNPDTLWNRIHAGWPVDRAMTAPVRVVRKAAA